MVPSSLELPDPSPELEQPWTTSLSLSLKRLQLLKTVDLCALRSQPCALLSQRALSSLCSHWQCRLANCPTQSARSN